MNWILKKCRGKSPGYGAACGMHFLCAEDNELNAEILQEILKIQGASCTVCKNGAEIVKKFQNVREGEYDAILMDVQMPVMNGYDAARAIRKGENQNKTKIKTAGACLKKAFGGLL